MKKTYIPSTPRSRKLKSVGGGTINVSGGSAQNVPVIEGHTHDNKIILDAITQLHLRILSSLNVDEDGALIVELSNIIKELDATVPTDENLFSALRTVLEIRARSISKTDPDTAQEIITFLKGIIASGTSKFDNIEVGNYTTGPLGAGAAIKMENGVSRMEVDQLDVRMRATFRELIIESLKHIGGQLILSPARMKCASVVDGGTYYKCYFDTGDGKVSNEFVAGDQARCQVFTGSGVKMYWRLVTSVGTDWINLSKTDAISGSSIPEAGDDIVQLGNRSDATRQNAQILSTVGADAPSWKQYKGINSFSLEGKDTTVFSGTGNKIDGKTVFTSNGANVEDGINSKNSNYSSQPTSYRANDTWTLSSDQTVNGIAYKSGEILTATQDSTTFVQAHWVKKVRYTDDTAVNNMQLGVRNLILKGGNRMEIAANVAGWVHYVLSEPLKPNVTYRFIAETLQFPASADKGIKLLNKVGGNNNDLRGLITRGSYFTTPYDDVVAVAFTKNFTTDADPLIAQNVAIYEGNKCPDRFVEAPEDVQAAIDAAVVKATYWSVKASAPVIYKDSINAATAGSHTSVTVSGELRSGTTTTSGGFITVTPNGGTEAGTATASPVAIAPANGDGKTSYTVRLYDTAAKTTLLDTMTIPVVFKGASGVNAINAILSNEADVLPASPEGTVSDYSGSGTIIRVFEGATELSYGTGNGQYQVSASGSGITAGTPSTSGNTRVYGVASNMTSDNATITFTITGKTASGTSFSLTKVQAFAKSRTGQKGDTGASAPLLYLSASAQVMKCNQDNTPQTGQTISIEAKLQNVSGTATFVATPYNDAGTALTAITLGGSGNTRTLTNAQWLATYKRIEVVATLGSLTDKVTIYRVADGATGDAGQNAIVGLLTNESVTLQANNAGTVSSFTPANGEFWVYNGVTKVTSGITFSKVSETGCTAAITSAGAYSVSAMSADNATVVLRAVYGGVTIDKVLTLSKSRAGADGVSISLVDVEFAKNTTPATPPAQGDSGWTTTAPAITGTEQLWTRTKTTYSTGNPTYSTPANITPKTGATGQGVDSVTEQFILSSSKTIQPAEGDVNWSTAPPPWENGKYIWSRVKVVYKNPTSTVYTGYAVSSEWEAINDMQIGGRNLISSNSANWESGWLVTTTGANFAASDRIRIKDFIPILQNKPYTLSIVHKSVSNVYGVLHFYDTNNVWISAIFVGDVSAAIGERTVLSGVSPASAAKARVAIMSGTSAVLVSHLSVSLFVQLEQANKVSDWTPSPEDVQDSIDTAKLTAEQAQLAADGYMRARYIRDWTKGNTSNNLNQWSEIKIFNKDGVNIALGKIPETNGVWNPTRPASNVTDNNIDSNGATNETTPIVEHYAKIDLGQIYYDIDYIQVWHPYADGRTYYGTKTEISVDGVNWTPVFDSAKSGTYKETAAGNIISFRPNEVLAKVLKGAAVTDTFKTTINGGLISTVMILLRELNSIIETAGISGIQDDGYLPAYWSGGTYAEALAFSELMRAVDRGDNPIASATLNAKMSSIVMLHNGHAKVGELIVKSNGQIIVLDKATGKIKFIINSQDIPSVADLMSGTAFGESKTNPSVSGITGIVTLQNTISVDKNNSTLSFAADISLTLRNYTKIADASMSVDLFKNGVLYLNLGSLSVVKLDEGTSPVIDSYSISKIISGIPTGTYSVKITVVASGDVRDYAGSISASTLAWNFTQSGVRYFQLGLNGLMAYYSDNHFHYTETEGLDVRGATNMPGVLAAGSSTSGGAQTNVWGAKSNSAGVTTITSPAAGFRVPLSGLSHSNYVVQITPHTNTTFRVGTKTSTYFEIYGSGGFDYVVIGKNYA